MNSSDKIEDRPADSIPVWFTRARPGPFPPPPERSTCDVAVVGAGIAGLLTALLLARAGRSVTVLEARRIGDGTSGHTTGKVSLLQGTKLSRVLRSNPPSAARKYVEAGREGQAWLRRYCDDNGLLVEDRHATTYAGTRVGEVRARAELLAARTVGLEAEWTNDVELPFEVRGAVRMEDQFQVDAMELLSSLTADVVAAGAGLHEGARVTGVDRGEERVTLTTDGGAVVDAGRVVLATNQPILDRGAFFARLQPQRSYAATLTSSWLPTGMHLSADLAVRSLRSVRTGAGEELLMVGGSGHVTGRGSPEGHVERLLQWAEHCFPDGEVRHVWSAQDQSPVTGLPYVGPLIPRDHRIQVVTGFDKWGLSTAPAAALVLAADILGGTVPSWGSALRSWTPREVLAAGRAAMFNAEVGWQLACGYAARPFRGADTPLCTHLGGVLSWNDAERSWDCPLHGSRFGADGAVLEGPATRPLGS